MNDSGAGISYAARGKVTKPSAQGKKYEVEEDDEE
jgi:hypothetical protein